MTVPAPIVSKSTSTSSRSRNRTSNQTTTTTTVIVPTTTTGAGRPKKRGRTTTATITNEPSLLPLEVKSQPQPPPISMENTNHSTKAKRTTTKPKTTNTTNKISSSSRIKNGQSSSTTTTTTITLQPPERILVIDNGSAMLKFGWYHNNNNKKDTNHLHIPLPLPPKRIPNRSGRLNNQYTVLVGDQLETFLYTKDPHKTIDLSSYSQKSMERASIITNLSHQILLWKRILDIQNVQLSNKTEVAQAFNWKTTTTSITTTQPVSSSSTTTVSSSTTGTKGNKRKSATSITGSTTAATTTSTKDDDDNDPLHPSNSNTDFMISCCKKEIISYDPLSSPTILPQTCGIFLGLPPYFPRCILEQIITIWLHDFQFSYIAFFNPTTTTAAATVNFLQRPPSPISILSPAPPPMINKDNHHNNDDNDNDDGSYTALIVDMGYSSTLIVPTIRQYEKTSQQQKQQTGNNNHPVTVPSLLTSSLSSQPQPQPIITVTATESSTHTTTPTPLVPTFNTSVTTAVNGNHVNQTTPITDSLANGSHSNQLLAPHLPQQQQVEEKRRQLIPTVIHPERHVIRRIPIGMQHLIQMFKYICTYRQYHIMDGMYDILIRDMFDCHLFFISNQFNQDLIYAKQVPRGRRYYDREYILPDYVSTYHVGCIKIPHFAQMEIDKLYRQQLQQLQQDKKDMYKKRSSFVNDNPKDNDDANTEEKNDDDDDEEDDEDYVDETQKKKKQKKKRSKSNKKKQNLDDDDELDDDGDDNDDYDDDDDDVLLEDAEGNLIMDDVDDDKNETDESDDSDGDGDDEDGNKLKKSKVQQLQEQQQKQPIGGDDMNVHNRYDPSTTTTSSLQQQQQQQSLLLSVERFTVPEMYFHPGYGIIPLDYLNVPQAIIQCINQCPFVYRPSLYRNIYLVGGMSTLLPNFVERLYQELRTNVPSYYKTIRIRTTNQIYPCQSSSSSSNNNNNSETNTINSKEASTIPSSTFVASSLHGRMTNESTKGISINKMDDTKKLEHHQVQDHLNWYTSYYHNDVNLHQNLGWYGAIQLLHDTEASFETWSVHQSEWSTSSSSSTTTSTGVPMNNTSTTTTPTNNNNNNNPTKSSYPNHSHSDTGGGGGVSGTTSKRSTVLQKLLVSHGGHML